MSGSDCVLNQTEKTLLSILYANFAITKVFRKILFTLLCNSFHFHNSAPFNVIDKTLQGPFLIKGELAMMKHLLLLKPFYGTKSEDRTKSQREIS